MPQRIGRHRRVVGVRAALIGFHDLRPFLQIIGEARARGLFEPLPRQWGHHHQRRAGRRAPALLRSGQQHVDSRFLEIDENGAAGHAVENEQAAMLMDAAGDGGDEAVGDHQPGRGFHMRAEHDVRLLVPDSRQDIVQRLRRERRIGLVGRLARRQNSGAFGKAARLDDLAPAEAEPSVPDHHHARFLDELTCDGFHTVSPAAGHHGDRRRAVGVSHNPRNVAHHVAKSGRHRIQGPVGKDNRIFEKAVGIDIVAQGWHCHLVTSLLQSLRSGSVPDRL